MAGRHGAQQRRRGGAADRRRIGPPPRPRPAPTLHPPLSSGGRGQGRRLPARRQGGPGRAATARRHSRPACHHAPPSCRLLAGIAGAPCVAGDDWRGLVRSGCLSPPRPCRPARWPLRWRPGFRSVTARPGPPQHGARWKSLGRRSSLPGCKTSQVPVVAALCQVPAPRAGPALTPDQHCDPNPQQCRSPRPPHISSPAHHGSQPPGSGFCCCMSSLHCLR